MSEVRVFAIFEDTPLTPEEALDRDPTRPRIAGWDSTDPQNGTRIRRIQDLTREPSGDLVRGPIQLEMEFSERGSPHDVTPTTVWEHEIPGVRHQTLFIYNTERYAVLYEDITPEGMEAEEARDHTQIPTSTVDEFRYSLFKGNARKMRDIESEGWELPDVSSQYHARHVMRVPTLPVKLIDITRLPFTVILDARVGAGRRTHATLFVFRSDDDTGMSESTPAPKPSGKILVPA